MSEAFFEMKDRRSFSIISGCWVLSLEVLTTSRQQTTDDKTMNDNANKLQTKTNSNLFQVLSL